MDAANAVRIVVSAALIMFFAVSGCYADEGVKGIPVPGHGTLFLKVPSGWVMNTVQDKKDSPPTMIFEPGEGKGFKLMVSALWDPKNAKGFDEKSLRYYIEEDKAHVVPLARETNIEVKRIDGPAARGFYYSATDKSPKPGRNELLTRAIVAAGNLLLSATLLSGSDSANEVELTLDVLKSARQEMN